MGRNGEWMIGQEQHSRKGASLVYLDEGVKLIAVDEVLQKF